MKSIYQINNSITKLSVNITTNGVDKALMKLGDQIVYENKPSTRQ